MTDYILVSDKSWNSDFNDLKKENSDVCIEWEIKRVAGLAFFNEFYYPIFHHFKEEK
jgi:hypothetical protein